jgi:hypothetical protein
MARKSQAEKIHVRMSGDLPINSRVAVAIVPDPYSTIGEKIQVVRSVRHDPLADMLSRGVIDQALYLAGRKWQNLHERSTIGSIGAIDPTKEAVDGGKMREPLSDSQINAFKELQAAKIMLGAGGARLMMNLLEDQLSMASLGKLYECDTGRKLNFLSLRVRECLGDLGKLWGYVG